MLPGGIGGIGRPSADVRVQQPQNAPSLRAGDMITARVESVDGHDAWLRVAGQLIRARAELPLRAGETVTLWVQSAGDPVWLRRIEPGPEAGTGFGPSAPAPETPAHLPSPAAPAGEQVSAAIRALVTYRLQPEAGQVDKLVRLLAGFPAGEQEMAASAAAWLITHGQNPTPTTVRQLLDQVTGPTPFALRPRLKELARLLRVAALEAVSSDDPELADKLAALADELENWGWQAPRERHHTVTGARGESSAGEASPSPRNLPAALQEASELLGDPAASEGREAARNALSETSNLLANVRRQLQPRQSGWDMGWMVVPLPVQVSGWRGDVLLARRRQEGRAASGNPDAAAEQEVHLFFYAPHLGALGIHLRLHHGALGATITASSDDARSALEEALPALTRSLADAGFAVGRLVALQGDPVPPLVLLTPDRGLPTRLDLRM